MIAGTGLDVEWARSPGLVPYAEALAIMEDRAGRIAGGTRGELVWLIEHPALLTAGTSAKPEDILDPDRFPVHWTGRGGEVTYHGPGQRIAYIMLDVRRRFGGDVRAFVHALENWIIAALLPFGVRGLCRPGRPGVWVMTRTAAGDTEAKIAALGIRIRRGVSFHGISINVAPDLRHYDSIVPCGQRAFGVTSLAGLGIGASMKDVDKSLRSTFEAAFGPSKDAAPPLRKLLRP